MKNSPLLPIAILASLTACGGGSGGESNTSINPPLPATNQAPVAQNDTGNVFAGQSIELDVMANDSDPEGDTLTIETVGDVASGRVVMDGSVLRYESTGDFSGVVTFSYTVVDGNGGSSEATVSIDVLNRLTLAGRIDGVAQSDMTITAYVDDNAYTATTNNQGQFQLVVGIASEEQSIRLQSTADDRGIQYQTWLNAQDGLLSLADDEEQINDVVLSLLTTREALLLDAIAQQHGVPVSSDNLARYRLLIDHTDTFNGALAAKIARENPSVELPDAYQTAADVLSDLFGYADHLAEWKSAYPVQYQEALDALMQSVGTHESAETALMKDLLIFPKFSSSGKTITFEALYFNTSENGTYFPNKKSITRTFEQGRAVYDVDDWLIVSTPGQYCENSTTSERIWDWLDAFSLVLWKRVDDVDYLIRTRTIATSSTCYSGYTYRDEVDVLVVPSSENMTFSHGVYAMELSQRAKFSDDNDAIEKVAARVSFDESGSFEGYVEANENNKSGQWQVDNGHLVVTLDEGVTTQYRQLNFPSPVNQYVAVTTRNNTVVDVDSYRIATYSSVTTTVKDSYTIASATADNPYLERGDSGGFGFVLEVDGTGYDIYKRDGEWKTSDMVFSWHRIGNTFSLNYYSNPNEVYVLYDYCDVDLPDCAVYQSRELEIVGMDTLTGNYLVRSHRSMDFSKIKSGSTHYLAGYVDLFTIE
ncbi:Ig-like domain-containing protein [Aestuariibacter halophilus]|uniref:Ig-like domain-containing protein n=1 Tax=Fluctibacter halophilus TaxID=226011 RepID=A0ABS8G6W8_9ALTE|nr:Ig-like domain-containing protein [Aestuariibacter halophilus]MCC2616334.1 Ig-like domain-containing protein [Aestuariibacter halophilus]